MKIRRKWIASAAALALIAGLSAYAANAFSQEARFGPPFMHRMGPGMEGPGMMGMGMMGMGPGMMDRDSALMGEMQVFHALLVNHDRIRRTVTNLTNGIRTVTESDDPQIAKLIRDHVGSMGQRVSTGRDPGLPIESPALRAIFRNKDKIKTTVETTSTGVIVVQTSSDTDTVAALQKHATEVSDLVAGGMQALHIAMMRNGPMMRGRMPGRMMRGMFNRQ
jgi:hypothetical protein